MTDREVDDLGIFGHDEVSVGQGHGGQENLNEDDEWNPAGRRSPLSSAGISRTGSPTSKIVQFQIGGGDDEDAESRRFMEMGSGDLGRNRAETIDYLSHPNIAISLLPPIAEERTNPLVINRSFSHPPSSSAKVEPSEKDYGFVELHVLSGDGEVNTKDWQQTARWIKYEEDLEEGSQRWGKPHVATLSFHSLLKLRQLIERDGQVILDMEETDMPGIAYRVVDELTSKSLIRPEDGPLLMRILLLKHKHVEESEGGWFRMKRTNTSTASALNLQNLLDEKNRNRSVAESMGLVRQNSSSKTHGDQDGFARRALERTSSGNYLRSPGINGGDHVTVEVKGMNESYCPSEEDLKWIQGKEHVTRRLPQGAEATLIFVGPFDAIRRPIFLFIRLKEASFIFNVSEIPVPVRFVTIILIPPNLELDLLEIGRAFGTLMSNKDFFEAAMFGISRKSLLVGINEFLDESIVLPPGDWNNRDLLPLHILQSKSKEIRKRRIKQQISVPPPLETPTTPTEPFHPLSAGKKEHNTFERTGYPFGGVWQDARRRFRWYWSDITDGLNFQVLATTIFIYCASVAQIITFAGLFGDKTGNMIGMSETLMVTAGGGVLFSLIGGQPLIPIGPTGPLLVFDEILYQSCLRMNIEFLPMRFWISIWLLLIVLVVLFFEGTVISKWFTRFTQDIFAVLTSVLLIFESMENLVEIYVHHPLGVGKLDTRPIALTINTTHFSVVYEETTPPPIVDETADLRLQPNTALLSSILMLGTFFIAYFLREFRNSVFLGERARRALGDFGVPIAVFTMVFLDYSATDTYTRKMTVPSGLEPSDPDQRDWVVDIMGREGDFDLTYALLAVLPALLLFILIFMTTQICELIVNSKERKMVKGGGFHLDILIIAFINVGCGIMGGPWLCCATLRALAHVTALTVYSQNNPPGEKPTIVEVKEQRLSNLTLSILIGSTVLLAPVLKFIPLAVLYGVFLYIGVASLNSTQLFERTALLFIPAKQHPQTIYVRRVRTWKMHMYTLIQFGCLGLLWGVKSIKDLSLAFPFVLMFLVPIRIQLKRIFKESELEALDGEGVVQKSK